VALVLSPSVVDLCAQVDALVADDALITSPMQLLGDAEALLEAGSRLTALAVRRLTAAEAVQACDAIAGKPLRSWLAEDLLLPDGQAARVRRLADALPRFARVREAFESGAINDAHADALVKALAKLPGELAATIEATLVEQARLDSPAGVAKTLDDLLEALGYEKESDMRREQRLGERGIDLATTLDGMRSIRGNLTPEVAAKLEAALRKAAEPCGPEDTRTPRQRFHDAIGEIANAYLAHGEEPKLGGAPVAITVTLSLEELERRAEAAWATLPSGLRISAETARRIACDGAIIPAVLGTASELLDLGRSTRAFNAAIRRAAWLEQHGTCAFRGCRRRCLELHHIVWWTHGGHTSLDNAAWLCAYHHWLVHEGGWTMRRNADRSFTFTSPTGIERTRHLQAA